MIQQIKGMVTPTCWWDRWEGEHVWCDKSPHLGRVILEVGTLEDPDQGRPVHVQA